MLAGIGDNRAGRRAAVPLTSAHFHYRTSGQDAAGMLLDMLGGEKIGVRALELGYEIMERASTGAPETEHLFW